MALGNASAKPVRTLGDICREIQADWKPRIHPWALPYFAAMCEMGHVSADRISITREKYLHDDLREVVLRFLVNSSTWRGEVARKIKKELKSLAEYK